MKYKQIKFSIFSEASCLTKPKFDNFFFYKEWFMENRKFHSNTGENLSE